MASPIELSLMGFNVILGLITIYITFLYWKEHKNPIDKATVFLVISGASASTYKFIMNVISTALGLPEVIVISIGETTVAMVNLALMGGVYYWFLAYLLNLKRFYTMPYVMVFWIVTYISITGQAPVLYMFLLIATILNFSFLIRNAIRNKNGLCFALAMYALINVINGFIPNDIVFYLVQGFNFVNILLGVNGWYEDKIFFSRKERKQIQNTWISRKIAN